MVRETAREVYTVARENGITLIAAGLAFYMFNSLIPLAVFLIIAVTSFGWIETMATGAETLFGFEPEIVIAVMADLIGEGTGRTRAALIAAVLLLWSSLTMFQSVNMAFGHVYGENVERSVLRSIQETILILATVGVTILLLVVIHVGLSLLLDPTMAILASIPLLGVILIGIFVPMFYLFPPPTVTLQEILPGAIFTAITWTICAVSFRIYLVTAESIRLYGIAGGVMLVLTWLYIGSVALLLGVVLNAVLDDRISFGDADSIEI